MFKGKRIFDKANRIRIGKGIESRQKLEKLLWEEQNQITQSETTKNSSI